MKKPSYAVAIELRKDDKELDENFTKLSEKDKWKWLAYATEHKPFEAIEYARKLIDDASTP